MMKVRKKTYLITYYTQIDNDYIDERQIFVKNKYNAKKIFNDLSALNNTVSIEIEVL